MPEDNIEANSRDVLIETGEANQIQNEVIQPLKE